MGSSGWRLGGYGDKLLTETKNDQGQDKNPSERICWVHNGYYNGFLHLTESVPHRILWLWDLEILFSPPSPLANFPAGRVVPHYHHERWDGSGYPKGLAGDQIPLCARIVAVVDVWDALLSDRPYRLGWPKEQVLQHIQAGSGTEFDPQVVEVFLKTARAMQ